MRHWPTAVPLAAAILLGLASFLPARGGMAIVLGAALMGAVLAAVHHAEVVAHRVGEPLGTLILALAVTLIEAALIVSMMVAGGPQNAALARDAVYSAVMLICNGVVGICLLVGGMRHREQSFRVEGAAAAYATLVAVTALALVLPSFTTSSPGPTYTRSQLAFAAVSSLVLWGLFVFVQTVRHRDYFLPPEGTEDENAHLPAASAGQAWAASGLLLVSLVAVVGLAKILSPSIEAAVTAAGAPEAVIGIAIAMLVLLPETLAAVRAARANRIQTSLNLSLGSALACIGLTIPAVVTVSVLFDIPLVLGLGAKDLVLLGLTFLVGTITLGSGRTNVMLGAVHLVLFAVFLFLSFVP